MFEKIYIKKNKVSDSEIDLGQLCEALLFYTETNFLLDRFNIGSFVKAIALEKLKEYVAQNIIKLYYRNSAIGIYNFPHKNGNGVGPWVGKSSAFDLEEQAYAGYMEVLGDKAAASISTEEFLKLCSPQEYTVGFQDLLISECEDETLMTSMLKVYLKSYLPQLDVSDITAKIDDKFATPLGGDAYIFGSNFNFAKANQKYIELLPKGHTLNWTSFLLYANESSGDLNIASQHQAELYTDDKHYPYLQNRVGELIKRVTKSREDIKVFQDVLLEEFQPIRDTINSGEKTLMDFTAILDKSLKFKKWLKKSENDSSLLHQYYQEVTKGTWMEKKTVKAARFGVFTGLGLLGDAIAGGLPIGSLASSVSDNYLLPKLFGGWKPNQFIENEVKSFLLKKK